MASRRNYQDHVKGFFRWAIEEGYTDSNPAAKIPPVRVPTNMPRPVSEEDLLTALAAADARMRAWLVLMALGGLRCLEVAALRPQDIVRSGDRTLLYLRECKGGGDGYVPAHPLILRALDEVPVRNDLWWSITAGTLSARVGRFLRSVGVDGGAHQLRHFTGTSGYRASGHDLLATAALMRHTNVKTTMVYAQLDPTRTAEVVHAVGLAGLEEEPTPPPPAEAPSRPVLRLVREDKAG